MQCSEKKRGKKVEIDERGERGRDRESMTERKRERARGGREERRLTLGLVSCETCLRGSNRSINRIEEEGTLGHGSKTKTIRPGLIGRTPEGCPTWEYN